MEGLPGWTDTGRDTGEGLMVAWGLLAPVHPLRGLGKPSAGGEDGARDTALCQAHQPGVLLLAFGAGHRRCFRSRSLAYGRAIRRDGARGACHDAAPALGLPWCFWLPGEREKVGGGGGGENLKKNKKKSKF